MPDYTVRFSRGNNDPRDNIYETAIIELVLDVDTSECKAEDAGHNDGDEEACHGATELTLTYRSLPQTGDPDHAAAAQHLLDPNESIQRGQRRSQQLQWTPNPNPDPAPPGAPPNWDPKIAGSKYEVTVGLDPIQCFGRRKGIATMHQIIPTQQGPQLSNARQVIVYNVVFSSCGRVDAVEFELIEFSGSRLQTRMIKYEDDIDSMNPGPYPDYPGVDRDSDAAEEWITK